MVDGLLESILREHEEGPNSIVKKVVVREYLGAFVSFGMMTITDLDWLLCSKWLIRNLVGCNSVSEG